MSILQQFNQTVHHLSNILRSVSIKKTRGVIKIVTLLKRLIRMFFLLPLTSKLYGACGQ